MLNLNRCTALDWLYSLFVEHTALQALAVLSLISAVGLGLGKVRILGVSLGVTFVVSAWWCLSMPWAFRWGRGSSVPSGAGACGLICWLWAWC